MKTSNLQVLLGTAATALGFLSLTGQANAFSLSGSTLSIGFECNNDVATLVVGDNRRGQWQYVDDNAADGLGGTHYELYGMGYMEDANYMYFAINTHDMQINAGRDSFRNGSVSSYNIGWNDLLINTTGRNLGSANGNLFGVHFGANSGGVSQVGLYADVRASSVAGAHTSNVHEYLTGVTRNFTASREIPTFEGYVSQQSAGTRQAYQNLSLSFNDYLGRQSASTQQAFQNVNLSFDDYLGRQSASTQQAFQNVNLSWEEYISQQPGRTRSSYNSMINSARSTVNRTRTNYNNLISNAQRTINTTRTNYNNLISNAQRTIDQTRVNYDRVVAESTRINNFNSNLFGSLSREGGLAYFDERGSNVIQSGRWISAIEMLNLDQLSQRGYERNRFQGGQTVAFRVARTAIEAEVPEPTAIFGLTAIGLALATGIRKRNASA